MPDSSKPALARPRRPDESMSLLVDIATQALDPGYAAAAARRSARGQAHRRSGAVLASTVVLAATLLVVIAAVQAHRGAPAASRTRDRLLAQVQARDSALDRLQNRLGAVRTETARLQDQALASSGAGQRLSARLAGAELAAGTTAVGGPGLRVTLDDDPQGANRVLDRDLQSVVNALWAAGAEAIAVNDQRLTAESAIRQAGDAILVNFQPVAPPYDVLAIGDPTGLDTGFGTSAAAARMRAYAQLYGLRFHYSRENSLTLAAAGGLTLRYAHATAAGGQP
jgi:uncharacterized protein YlxW (UPF0749 family)